MKFNLLSTTLIKTMKPKTEQLKIRPQRELYVDGALIKTRLVKDGSDRLKIPSVEPLDKKALMINR